jgi:thioesterase domain-containing protein
MEQRSSVIAVQAGDPEADVMFLVPGAGASVTAFLSLARTLGAETTLYGLQHRGLDGVLPPHSTVEAAVDEFVVAIRRVCPHGPYRIAGHSFGGWIAYEIAARLTADREHLHTLVLLDSDPPAQPRVQRGEESPAQTRTRSLLRLIGLLEQAAGSRLDLGKAVLERLDERRQLGALADAMKRVGLIPHTGKVSGVELMVRVFEANLNTMYIPSGPVRSDIVLVHPEEEIEDETDPDPLDPSQRLLRWRQHVPHIRRMQAPGNHMTMLDSPNVESLGRLLRELWRLS